MIRRAQDGRLRALAASFPLLAVVGPRQSGKTTLVKATFAGKPYVLLEDPDTRASAEEDPRGFLARFPDGAILDEVQRVPALFSYLQGVADADGRPGLFVLTGSQHFLLMEKIAQSLAGRIAFCELLPLSLAELSVAGMSPRSYEEAVFRGFYPRLFVRGVPVTEWFSGYVRTYLERDVRLLKNVHDLSAFQTFLKMCAHRAGQTLNLSALALDCGVTHNTAKAWLSLLEAAFVVFRLPAHHANFRKQLVKSPKIYFHDTGLLCFLLGLRDHRQIAVHPSRGALFENLVLAELVKRRANAGEAPALSFWRDKTGHEVDCLARTPSGTLPIEIKSGRTVTDDFFAGLRYWTALSKSRQTKSFVVYGGDAVHVRRETTVLPWCSLDRLPLEA